jgi:hypothetical protein
VDYKAYFNGVKLLKALHSRCMLGEKTCCGLSICGICLDQNGSREHQDYKDKTKLEFETSQNLVLNIVFLYYNYNDQVSEDEMGGACSTNGGEEE